MKKGNRILILTIAISLFLTACGSRVVCETTMSAEAESETVTEAEAEVQEDIEAELKKEQHELYEKYIVRIDEMLVDNKTRVESCAQYREFVSSIFLYNQEDYHGWLRADYDESGVAAIQMQMETGVEGEMSDDKQRWCGKVLEDGSWWMSYQATYDEKYDLPDYIVNDSILRYSRADYVYDDGTTDIEQKKAENKQQIENVFAESIAGVKKEFWGFEDKIYQIDRINQLFVDVTEELGGLQVSFLVQQPERIACRIRGNEAAYEAVEQWKPEDYSQLSSWNDIAVSDLNADGRNDYVVALYPNDFEEIKRYEGFSPYEKRSEYYAASFWLLLSTETGEYEQKQLTDSIEYTVENALTLTEVTFVKDNRLQLEYFVGRSPWYNAVLQFEYDGVNEDFYLYRTYFRESCGGKSCKFLIGSQEDYGEVSMDRYFWGSQNYRETMWDYANDVALSDKAELGYYCDGFRYGGVNLLKAHHLNSLIWDKEYEYVQGIQEKYQDEELDIRLIADSMFYNENLLSGLADGDVDIKAGQGEKQTENFAFPIMIDRDTEEYVNVTECIDRASFLQIFRNCVKEERKKSQLDSEETECFEDAILLYWENADSLEQLIEKPSEILCVQIVSEGVMIGTKMQGKTWIDYFTIDKEFFLGTELWKYWEVDVVSIQPEMLFAKIVVDKEAQADSFSLVYDGFDTGVEIFLENCACEYDNNGTQVYSCYVNNLEAVEGYALYIQNDGHTSTIFPVKEYLIDSEDEKLYMVWGMDSFERIQGIDFVENLYGYKIQSISSMESLISEAYELEYLDDGTDFKDLQVEFTGISEEENRYLCGKATAVYRRNGECYTIEWKIDTVTYTESAKHRDFF